ncbi:MAG: anhydro-N-acetylmuramic acid kinase [Rickettsiales bacterium]|nr:anhydro-N-acetylmuramic acid kinase [Rickettsiales bacterium]
MKALGLMSGTSLDGIDAAIIDTDGYSIDAFGPSITLDYPEHVRDAIRDVISGHGDVLAAEKIITEYHAKAALHLLDQHNISPSEIDVIGFHGQTIIHRPDEAITWQIGNGSLLAERTGIDVVCDFRRMDMSLGGQGAPLVPIFHKALFQRESLPVVIVNIGGVSNVTWIGEEDAIMAFDTGPGNALINDFMMSNIGKDFDEGGMFAAKGNIHFDRVETILKDDFFAQKPPKSLDRNRFNKGDLVDGLSKEDAVATLSYFTAKTIAHSEIHFPQTPKKWIVTGGGRLNLFILDELQKMVEGQVVSIDDYGFNGDDIEAQAFGYLAVRSLKRLPITFPDTTGAQYPVTGGALYVAPKQTKDKDVTNPMKLVASAG